MCQLSNSELWRPDPGLPWQLAHWSLPFFSLLTPVSVSLHPQRLAWIVHLHYSRLMSLQTNTKPVVTDKALLIICERRSAFSSVWRCNFLVISQVSGQLSGSEVHLEPFPSTWYTYSQLRYRRHAEGQCGSCMATRSHGNWWYGSFSVGWAGAGTDIQEKKMVWNDEMIESRKEMENASCQTLVGTLIMASKPQST